jgi:hypothetical protein
MKDYVSALAKTISTLVKNEMNSVINKLTLWSQDRSVGVVICYKLDGQGSIPSPVGTLCLGVLWCLINFAQGVHWEVGSPALEVGWLW